MVKREESFDYGARGLIEIVPGRLYEDSNGMCFDGKGRMYTIWNPVPQSLARYTSRMKALNEAFEAVDNMSEEERKKFDAEVRKKLDSEEHKRNVEKLLVAPFKRRLLSAETLLQIVD